MPSSRSSPKPAAENTHDRAFDALGTRWVITTPHPLPPTVIADVDAELDRIDRTWSRFRDDSTVAEMICRAGRFDVAPTDLPLLDWYRRLYDATDGAVSPLVGQTLVDAGYDARYSLTPGRQVAVAPRWEDVIRAYRDHVELAVPAVVDVGAAGKGFAVDRVAEIVADAAEEWIVDGGGDMRVSPRAGGRTEVRVALEHPLDATKAIGVATLSGGSICASAANRRSWADWHHIVDPRSAAPAADVMATWVIGPERPLGTMIADGLATALFFTAPAELLAHPAMAGLDVDVVVVRRNGTVQHSDSARLEVFG